MPVFRIIRSDNDPRNQCTIRTWPCTNSVPATPNGTRRSTGHRAQCTPRRGNSPARLLAGALLRLRTDHGQTSSPQQSRPSSTGPRSLAPTSWAFFGEVFITYSPGDGRACWAGSLRGSRPTDDDQRRRVCVYGFGAFLKSPGGFPFFNQPFPLTSQALSGGACAVQARSPQNARNRGSRRRSRPRRRRNWVG